MAVEFAGLQCQIQFGDYQDDKHKSGFIENLNEYLPVQYSSSWGVEKKILKAYSKHKGLNEVDAKHAYTKTARELPTYGVTFFLVKEQLKDKKKLVPRLLGINAAAILRLDEVTKEVLHQWPLTHVKTYHAGKGETFTLNFGDYSAKQYTVKTRDAYRIRDILEGYIDIIRKRMLAQYHSSQTEQGIVSQHSIHSDKANMIQHISNSPMKIVETSFVGPSKIVQYEPGQTASQGAQIVTVSQIITSDKSSNKAQAVMGEVPMRGDMTINFSRRLNRLNSSSVKVVSLLGEPSDNNIQEAKSIVDVMKENMPFIRDGVKETIDNQTNEDEKKKLQEQLRQLEELMKHLEDNSKPGSANASEAEQAAKEIADLTTQMYFAMDLKSKRQSQMLNRSRKSFIADERTEKNLRRASFIAATATASHSIDNAHALLTEEYRGPALDAKGVLETEQSAVDRLGKINAAIAHYSMAHSDPKNIDYATAVNSLNTINELVPELAKDGRALASVRDGKNREQLLNDLKQLCVSAKRVCSLSGVEDFEKLQDASSKYADAAGRLVFTFGRGSGARADKEDEIMKLAKSAASESSRLLQSTRRLCEASGADPRAAPVDGAGARVAASAKHLISTAELTAPTIQEPHCQSALTAASEALSSSAQHLAVTWKPLVEAPDRHELGDKLHHETMKLFQALDRLKESYNNLDDGDDDPVFDGTPQEIQRLKFTKSKNRVGAAFQVAEDELNKEYRGPALDAKRVEEIEQSAVDRLGKINAAIAHYSMAHSDPKNIDYATAASSLDTIHELIPELARDGQTLASVKDGKNRKHLIKELCDAAKRVCSLTGDEDFEKLQDASNKYADAAGRLVFSFGRGSGARADKENEVMELAKSAASESSRLLQSTRRLCEASGADPRAAPVDDAGARVSASAKNLLSTAELTAPTIQEPHCQSALTAASEALSSSAQHLAVTWKPLVEAPDRHELGDELRQRTMELAQALDRLKASYSNFDAGDVGMQGGTPQELQRLKFVKSMNRVGAAFQAAEDELNEPAPSSLNEVDAIEAEQRLAQRLAQLNAAIASLLSATSDRGNPNHETAELAIRTINELMPELVKDSKAASANKDEASRAAMLDRIRALCEASRRVCASSNGDAPEDLNDAVAKFTDASGKLVYVVGRQVNPNREEQIIDLASGACNQTFQVLSGVQLLAEAVGGERGTELDARGAFVADAAQDMLRTAQVTAPSISEPRCQSTMLSAIDKVSSSGQELQKSWTPLLEDQKHRPQVVSMQNGLKELENQLEKLRRACHIPDQDVQVSSGTPQEQQRLQFVKTITGAKDRLKDVHKELDKPAVPAKGADVGAIQHRLSDRLGQLNAAIASLLAATKDRENPDYAKAEEATKTIAELMPHVIKDTKTASSSMDEASRAAMLARIGDLCDACEGICANSLGDNAEGLNDAVAKYTDASGKMVYVVSKRVNPQREQQIIDLSMGACNQTFQLLSGVQLLAEAVGGERGVELDARGASVGDAAQSMLSTAQVTAPSISEPHCRATLLSSIDKVSSSGQELAKSWTPLLEDQKHRPQVIAMQNGLKELEDQLEKLRSACQIPDQDVPDASGPVKEQQKLQFIKTMTGAKDRLKDVFAELDKPASPAKGADVDAIQHRLSDRLGQLNAAIASLLAATKDRENPDYGTAEEAIKTITELTPQVIKDTKSVSASKDEASRAAMLAQIEDLCNACEGICANSLGDNAEGLNDAVAKYTDASGKLVYVVSKRANPEREQQIIDLSTGACSQTFQLLSGVQLLAEAVGGEMGVELDARGAAVADAAQSMLSTAQMTASSISEPHCRSTLLSAIDKVFSSGQELAKSWTPLHKDQKHRPQVIAMQAGLKELEDQLEKLRRACQIPDRDVSVPSATPREQLRLQFAQSTAGAKDRLKYWHRELDKPALAAKGADVDGIQQRLSHRLGQLNAAIASLLTATKDRKNLDYAKAEEAIKIITELMPQAIKDTKTVSCAKDEASRAAMLAQIRDMCDACEGICNNTGGNDEIGLNDALAKYTNASGNLVYAVSKRVNPQREEQIIDLSTEACNQTFQLLSGVQLLAGAVGGARGTKVDARGAAVADAAQSMLSTAQVTAPSISEPDCRSTLLSSIDKVSSSGQELANSWTTLLEDQKHRPQVIAMQAGLKDLEDQLEKLRKACQIPDYDLQASAGPQQAQRLQFVRAAADAKGQLKSAHKELDKPALSARGADVGAVRSRLCRRLDQLNAAIASQRAAMRDRENPDYAKAEESIKTIAEIMPQVIKDTKTVSCGKEEAGRAAMLAQIRDMCDACEGICSNAGSNDAECLDNNIAKYTSASDKLASIIEPNKATKLAKPEVPKRVTARAVPHGAAGSHDAQEFLDRLRCEESQAFHSAPSKSVIPAETTLLANKSKSDAEKRTHLQFEQSLDAAERRIKEAEDCLVQLCKADNATPSVALSAADATAAKDQMQHNLALAGVEVATLVAANYADKIDYAAASKSTKTLPELVCGILNDGKKLSSTATGTARLALLDDMLRLCEASRNICEAAKNEREKLNESALEFGDKSAKLLYAVSCDADSKLEKEIISRAKAIGDSASRLALEAASVATSGTESGAVKDICDAGTSCVDAAGKLVYTAKLVAPSIHEASCQSALISSSDHLSNRLKIFSDSWKPLSSDPKQAKIVKDLDKEAENLERILAGLREDVQGGRIGRRREMEKLVIEDTPLKLLTTKILEDAKKFAEHDELPAPLRKEYASYAHKLTDALRALDLANARCKKAPHDLNKHRELENAIQDLQLTLLQSRPKRGDKGNSHIVDLRDYIEEVSTEARNLSDTARSLELKDIGAKLDTIQKKANKLMNVDSRTDLDTTFDDILEVDDFGQECDDLIGQINAELKDMENTKTKRLLLAKMLPLVEGCNMLRFATKSGISTSAGARLDSTLESLDDIEARVIKGIVKDTGSDTDGVTLRSPKPFTGESAAAAKLCRELALSSAVAPASVVSYIADAAVRTDTSNPEERNRLLNHLYKLVHLLKTLMATSGRRTATWQPADGPEVAEITKQILQEINNPEHKLGGKADTKNRILDESDLDKLLLPGSANVVGDQKQQEAKVTQLATKVSSMCGALSLSIGSPASLARSAHALAGASLELAAVARGTVISAHDQQHVMIEEAAKETCLATYDVLKTAELANQDPENTNVRRRLLDSCEALNESIDKLVAHSSSAPALQQSCATLQRRLALQQSALAPRPRGTQPFQDCCNVLDQQKETIYKLKSDEPMPRVEFLRSLDDISSSVRRSTDIASQCAYFIAVSDQDKEIAKRGLVDVPHVQKTLCSIQDSCMAVIGSTNIYQAKEEADDLRTRVQDLSGALDRAQLVVASGEVRKQLATAKTSVSAAADQLCTSLKSSSVTDKIMHQAVCLLEEVTRAHATVDRCALVPKVGHMAPDTKAKCDELMNQSKTLLTNTMALVKDVNSKASPNEDDDDLETMTWVTFNTSRRQLLDAYDTLVKSIKTNGHRAGILANAPAEEKEVEQKSYVETQVDLANKWLKKPMSNAETKKSGQQAVRIVIDIATQMSEELKGAEREEVRIVITETEELLCKCTKKYDHEKYSVLSDRLKELKRTIQRGVATRVVEDFMDAESPLADLDVLTDTVNDENQRKYILERKIASLLAQLGRVTKTARFVAGANQQNSGALNKCTEQTELLAPMLVQAAQQRINLPHDETVVANYKSLLAKYAESMGRVRELCERAVDPMDFVQTAGDTMQRMRDELSNTTDPQKCAHTSSAITRLANRVIHVSMSSNAVQSDPELQKSLIEAKKRLHAVVPGPNTRPSRLPDWRDTTAEILRTTGDVESALGGENIFKKQPTSNQAIYSVARDLHECVRGWSSRDNEVVAAARRMAVLMARLSQYMETEKKEALLATSKSIVLESHEVAEMAKKLAHECTDVRIKTNLLQTCERIPTISGQLKMLTAVKGSSMGQQGSDEDKEAMDMLVGNAESLMLSIQEVVKAAASASVKIMSQRGPRLRWVRKNYY